MEMVLKTLNTNFFKLGIPKTSWTQTHLRVDGEWIKRSFYNNVSSNGELCKKFPKNKKIPRKIKKILKKISYYDPFYKCLNLETKYKFTYTEDWFKSITSNHLDDCPFFRFKSESSNYVL